MTQPAPFLSSTRKMRPPSDNPAKNNKIVSNWNGEILTRYNLLKSEVTRLVGKQNAFGIVRGNIANVKTDFSRGQDRTRVRDFRVWLENLENRGDINIIDRPGWADPLITQNFAVGGTVASIESHALVSSVPILRGSAIGDFVGRPLSIDRIRFAQTAVRNGMEGITLSMNNQISEVIARGLASGTGATQMARNINNRISKIGMTRAKLIARTESNFVYSQGAFREFDVVSGIIDEVLLTQYWATLDDRVRASHLARHGKIFTLAEGQLLFGEPNCRCAPLPFIQSVEGPATLSKASTFISNAVIPERWGKGFDWDSLLQNAEEGVCCG